MSSAIRAVFPVVRTFLKIFVVDCLGFSCGVFKFFVVSSLDFVEIFPDLC
jgi:hypothetical protein